MRSASPNNAPGHESCLISKLVFPLPQGGEYSGRIAGAFAQILVCGFDDCGPHHAQERVGGLLAGYRRGKRREVVAPQARIAGLALEQRGIAWLDGLGKADVRQRVFVPAIHERVIGQRGKLLERRVQLLWRSLEYAPTSAGEQRIATEHHV